MKTYKWQKEFINGKWYTVCTSHKHVPLVKWNSDGTYSVKGSDGKPRIEKEWKNARKRFALSVRECMLERVDGAACDAASAASAGDETAFITAKRRLVAALENIADGGLWDFLSVF